jgi:hypothetical protein
MAVGFHSVPRYTKDIDVLVCIRPPDQERLYQCLREFGIPAHLVAAEEFLGEDFVFHFGIPPWRVDLLTSIPGVDFVKAYEERVQMPLGEYQADCLSKEWLIRAKRASGRPQDLLDIEALTGPKSKSAKQD